MLSRRLFLSTSTLGVLAVGSARFATTSSAAAPAFEVMKSNAEWRKALSPSQYAVLREEGTERAYTSPLLHEERPGNFSCAGCDLALFSSATKFDSGTGWPSFWKPIDSAVTTKQDRSYGTVRTAVECRRCGGHLCHVFDDGPQPTGPALLHERRCPGFQTRNSFVRRLVVSPLPAYRACLPKMENMIMPLTLRGTSRRLSRRLGLPLTAVIAAFVALSANMSARAEEAWVIPAPKVDEASGAGGTSAVAVLAGGCFWGVQGVFQHVKGVRNAVSGYAGGSKSTANYETVSDGTTGHAEAVEITYDPSQISYGKLLQIYFSVAHDPTSRDFQGPDTGTQYRSAVFPANPEQARIAKAYIAQLDATHIYPAAIVTTIEPGRAFFPAEEHHQDFLTLNPTYPYIVVNDLPKVANLKRLFPQTYAAKPMLVASAGRTN